MITKKEYKCGICGEIELVETNHSEEIYSSCSICGNSIRSCIKTINLANVQGTCRLLTYKYNLANPEDQLLYRDLLVKLNSFGYIKHEDISFGYAKHSYKWRQIEENLNGKIRPVYHPGQFEGQYVSNGVRLFDWCEAIFENKNIKVGYYLTEKEGF